MNEPVNNLQRWGRGLTLGLCLGGSALTLSGCFSGVQYESDNQVSASDYHDRHPIVLGKAPTSLDLFPVGGRLDMLSQDKIKGFAERYRTFGTGEVMILVPARRSHRRRSGGADPKVALRQRFARLCRGRPPTPSTAPSWRAPFVWFSKA